MSRLPSAGTPFPDCQEGFAYPPAQVDGVVPPGVVQLLTPPDPPTGTSTYGISRESLQLVSGLELKFGGPKAWLVQVEFQGISGI